MVGNGSAIRDCPLFLFLETGEWVAVPNGQWLVPDGGFRLRHGLKELGMAEVVEAQEYLFTV